MNLSALRDAQPYTYWFTIKEAVALLVASGFKLRYLGTGRQVLQEKLFDSAEPLAQEPLEGMLYVVCRK